MSNAKFFFDLGQKLIRLRRNDKIPMDTGWTTTPRDSWEQVERNLAQGFNLGLVTGDMFFVIDVDVDKGGKIPENLPKTWIVKTPHGLHLFFRMREGCKTGAGHLAQFVDTRGKGGMVVAPGSVVAGIMYDWLPGHSPKDVDLADTPDWVVEALKGKRRVPQQTKGSKWFKVAYNGILTSVATATEGTRNDTLNGAAYRIGQLMQQGLDVSMEDALNALVASGMASGMSEDECRKTAFSGLDSGSSKPVPVPVATTTATAPIPKSRGLPIVVLPGSGKEDGVDKRIEYTDFAKNFYKVFPQAMIYVRGSLVGRLLDDKFTVLDVTQMRWLGSNYVEFHKALPDGGTEPALLKEDNAKILLAAAVDFCPKLDYILPFPFLDKDRKWRQKGYHPDYNAYVTCDKITPMTDVKKALATIQYVIQDFDFEDECSRQNYYGILLSPCGLMHFNNRPFGLIKAAKERTGKTKLIDEVHGTIWTGKGIPVMQLSNNEDEREKRLTAVIIEGRPFVLFDNATAYTNSPSLASFITSPLWSGRFLGRSEIIELKNSAFVYMTANNPQMTAELAKRCCVVTIEPRSDEPEFRVGFTIKYLRAYVEEHREELLAAIMCIWNNWNGLPGDKVFGGFEEWTAIMSGVLRDIGMTEFLNNTRKWVEEGDSITPDWRRLCELWSHHFGDKLVSAAALFDLVQANDLFDFLSVKGDQPNQRRAFTAGILNRRVGQVYEGKRLRKEGKAYRWVAIASDGATS